MLITMIVVSVFIVAIVILLAVVTTSKAYTIKHTVDKIDTHPSTVEHSFRQDAGETKSS